MSVADRESKARRAARRASRRLRYNAALARLALWLPLPLGYAAVTLALVKVFGWGPGVQRVLVAGGALIALVSLGLTLVSLLRRPPRWAGSLALDRHHALGDRVTTALSLLQTPAKHAGGLEVLAIEDGLAQVDRLDPRRAVPVPVPREFGVSLLLLVALLGAGWFEVRTERILPPPPRFEPLVMAADDLDLFGDIARRLADRSEDPQSLAQIRRFNALIEDIAARRLERRDAFERLGDLEAELARSAELDREAREVGLEGLSRELQKSGLAKSAAQALEQKKLADAEQALRELAEKLLRKDRPPSRAELDKLRSALQRASAASGERMKAVEQRRRELQEEKQSLLKRKSEGGKNAPSEGAIEENKRRLERLERDKERAERAARELSDLDRELAKAAEELAKMQPKSAAEDIRRSADELSKMGKRELSDKEKRELLERLRELKELLRQQGQGGQERMRQMSRFGQRARGGQSQQRESQEGRGKGQRPGTAEDLSIEQFQVPQLVRQRVGVSGSGEGKPGEGGQPPGGSKDPGTGKDYGSGHDEKLLGDATKPVGQTHDVSAASPDTGQGTASAEVIHGAAERGFLGKAYRDVYVEYQGVAEQSLEHDQIPPGYRFYVRRYFQLIRPRE